MTKEAVHPADLPDMTRVLREHEEYRTALAQIVDQSHVFNAERTVYALRLERIAFDALYPTRGSTTETDSSDNYRRPIGWHPEYTAETRSNNAH